MDITLTNTAIGIIQCSTFSKRSKKHSIEES